MATFQERLAILIEANAGKAVAEFKKVRSAAQDAGQAAEGGAKGFARFGIAGEAAGNLLKAGIAAGVAGAATAIAKFAVDGVNAFVEVTGEIRKFQRVSGASAEDASKLISAFHVLGIDSDTAANAVFQLSRRIESSGEKLAAVGVQVARTKSGAVDVVETLLNIGDAYKATIDPAERANLVFTAFGRGGAPIIPILGKTREELEAIFAAAERHGLIFNQEQLDKARDLGIATRELSESFKGLEVAVGEKLVPFLTDLAIALTKVNDAAHGKALQGLLLVLGSGLGPTVVATGKLLHLLAGNEGEVARAALEATDAMDEQKTKFDDLQKAIFASVDADRSVAAASRSVDAANRSLADAQADLNKLMAQGAVDTEKVADAQRSYDEATRSLGHAQREQTKAQTEYNKALAEYQLSGSDDAADKLADAKDNLADADDNVADALGRQTDAAGELAKAKAGDPDYQNKLADAKQHVADATQGVADAEYNLGRRSFEAVAAHDAETQALSDKADQVDRLKTYLTDLLKLHPEQQAFIGPILAALANVPGTPGTAPPNSLQGTLLGGAAGAVTGGGVQGTLTSGAAGAVTNNVTINTTSDADARLIAKEVMWNLN